MSNAASSSEPASVFILVLGLKSSRVTKPFYAIQPHSGGHFVLPNCNCGISVCACWLYTLTAAPSVKLKPSVKIHGFL